MLKWFSLLGHNKSAIWCWWINQILNLMWPRKFLIHYNWGPGLGTIIEMPIRYMVLKTTVSKRFKFICSNINKWIETPIVFSICKIKKYYYDCKFLCWVTYDSMSSHAFLFWFLSTWVMPFSYIFTHPFNHQIFIKLLNEIHRCNTSVLSGMITPRVYSLL